jgi:hypothetical protein
MNPSLRLSARYRIALEFPSEDARKKYLHDHPKADPSNHTVKENGTEGERDDNKGKSKKPKDEAEGHGEHGKSDEAKKPKGNFFKGLSERARALVSRSSAAVQKLVSDEEHRAKVMSEAGKTILASPKTYAKRLVQTAKEELHEFKAAGAALKDVASGKKLDPHQKKALKTVAIHMSIAVTAAALTSTGVLAGAAAVGKGMVQKIALKAAAHALEKVHLVQEIQHIGHGAHELFEAMHHVLASEEDEKDDDTRKVDPIEPEEAFAILVMQSVIKIMKELDDQDMADILEGASGEQEKQAFRVAGASNLPQLLVKALDLFQQIDQWMARFNSVLVASRAEAGDLDGRVWQDRFVQYLRDGEQAMEGLRDLDQLLDEVPVETPALLQVVHGSRQAVRIPQKAEVTQAIADIEFRPDPKTGRDGITYSINALKTWSNEVVAWSKRGQQTLRQMVQKTKRLT